MENRYFIVYCKIKGSKLFISNTSPILWTDNINQAKEYDYIDDVKSDLLENHDIFVELKNNTEIEAIYIAEYDGKSQSIRREKFL